MKFLIIISILFNVLFSNILKEVENTIENNINICKSISIDSFINDECSEYIKRTGSIRELNFKFNSTEKKSEKIHIFNKWAPVYREVEKYGYLRSISRDFNNYILDNYASSDKSILNTVDKIFSNKHYIASDSVLKKLVDNGGGNLSLSQNGLSKVKIYAEKLALEQKKQAERKQQKQAEREQQKLDKKKKEKNLKQKIKSKNIQNPEEQESGISNSLFAKLNPQDFSYYSKNCEKGNAEACNNLSVMYMAGIGVKEDLRHAAKLSQWACENGSANACEKICTGLYFAKETETKKYRHYLRLGCNFGSAHLCKILRRR